MENNYNVNRFKNGLGRSFYFLPLLSFLPLFSCSCFFPISLSYYLNYKSLKQSIKQAAVSSTASASEEAENPGVLAFYYALDRELEKVDGFFLRRWQELDRRSSLLADKWAMYTALSEEEREEQRSHWAVEREDRGLGGVGDPLQEFTVAVSHLHRYLDRLHAYASLNTLGFGKILKKFDKRLHRTTRSIVLTSKVNPLPFASGTILAQLDDRVKSLRTEILTEEKRVRGAPEGSRQSTPPLPSSSSVTPTNGDHISPTKESDGLDGRDLSLLRSAIDQNDPKELKALWSQFSPKLTLRGRTKVRMKRILYSSSLPPSPHPLPSQCLLGPGPPCRSVLRHSLPPDPGDHSF